MNATVRHHKRPGIGETAAAWRRPVVAAALLAAAGGLTGCDDFLGAADRPEQSAWEGTFVPVSESAPMPPAGIGRDEHGDDEVNGTVAAVDHGGQTEVALNITSGPTVTELGWLFRTGECGGGGDAVGPPMSTLETTSEGTYAEEFVSGFGMDPEGDYAVDVVGEAGDGDVLSCADLERVDGSGSPGGDDDEGGDP